LIEAVTMAGNTSVFAVQWHPELMFDQHPEHLGPFNRLVELAAARSVAAALV
jgi:gamma-glutamyl-gamma-aminobutyrate hydrolase PuuD